MGLCLVMVVGQLTVCAKGVPRGHAKRGNAVSVRFKMFQEICMDSPMNSLPVSQLALQYGADDIDGTFIKDEVTKDQSQGSERAIDGTHLVSLISELGLTPVERDSLYREAA